MGDADNCAICKDSSAVIKTLAEVQAGQRYLVDAINELKSSFGKLADSMDDRIEKAVDQKARAVFEELWTKKEKEKMETKKFDWQRITFTIALLISILFNILNVVKP